MGVNNTMTGTNRRMIVNGTLIFAFMVLIASAKENKLTSERIPTTIRADSCIANETHCHCSLIAPSPNSVCLKPLSGTGTTCMKGQCAAGYRCDCEANLICEKASVPSYKTNDTSNDETVTCMIETTKMPKTVVGQTSDFYIEAYQSFELFVNEKEIGYGIADESKVFSAEINSGDVIAVVAKRKSESVFGVKLRFVDVQDETRTIDENWFASSTLVSSWLSKEFDPVAAGWTAPSLATTVTSDGFDKNIPWMWFGDADTVYFRYVIP